MLRSDAQRKSRQRLLVSAAHMCVISIQARRSEIASQGHRRTPSHRSVFQNPFSGVSSSEWPCLCCRNTHAFVSNARQMDVNCSLGRSFVSIPIHLLALASSGRSAWVAIRRTTQNIPTLADPGCLVSATHMCVIPIQARSSEIASRGHRRTPSHTSVFQNPVSRVCSSE